MYRQTYNTHSVPRGKWNRTKARTGRPAQPEHNRFDSILFGSIRSVWKHILLVTFESVDRWTKGRATSQMSASSTWRPPSERVISLFPCGPRHAWWAHRRRWARACLVHALDAHSISLESLWGTRGTSVSVNTRGGSYGGVGAWGCWGR